MVEWSEFNYKFLFINIDAKVLYLPIIIVLSFKVNYTVFFYVWKYFYLCCNRHGACPLNIIFTPISLCNNHTHWVKVTTDGPASFKPSVSLTYLQCPSIVRVTVISCLGSYKLLSNCTLCSLSFLTRIHIPAAQRILNTDLTMFITSFVHLLKFYIKFYIKFYSSIPLLFE